MICFTFSSTAAMRFSCLSLRQNLYEHSGTADGRKRHTNTVLRNFKSTEDWPSRQGLAVRGTVLFCTNTESTVHFYLPPFQCEYIAMPLMTVLVVVALVVGVVLGFWIQANKSRPAHDEVERLRQSEMELRTTIARLEAEKKAVQGQWTESNRALEAEKTRCARAEADLMSLREQVAQLSTALEKERQSAQEKLDLLEGKFKLLADDILKKRAR